MITDVNVKIGKTTLSLSSIKFSSFETFDGVNLKIDPMLCILSKSIQFYSLQLRDKSFQIELVGFGKQIKPSFMLLSHQYCLLKLFPTQILEYIYRYFEVLSKKPLSVNDVKQNICPSHYKNLQDTTFQSCRTYLRMADLLIYDSQVFRFS